ncbi:hypothetical protein L1049_028349 [Liquidambar formosana]|uniref:Apyrase n=1 Tax=Liquidambar formosana TaxID=63359 RepID=A0AAP0WW56_LIQFO
MEPRSPSKFKLPIVGFIHYRQAWKIGIALIVVFLLLVGIYHAFKSGRNFNMLGRSYFSVVVDCGSTGTRINVYKWMIKDVNNRDLPILVHSYPDNSTKSPISKVGCQYHCMQTEPGLDKFVGNSSGVRASLEPLILWAEQQIPSERHGETPMFILATAGLRQLPIEDARRILEDAEAVVKEHSFMYRKSWIRVLSGKEEAYYGWLALNYKMGSLENSSALHTLGVLDLGGSSLQVVMEIDNSREREHLVRSNIGSIEHQILAYSLPAFGLNEAFHRTVVMLSQVQSIRESSGGPFELKHPCLSSGFVQNYTCNGCFGPNTTDWKNSGQMWNNHMTSVYLVGDPNWDQCKELARAAAINSSRSEWSQSIISSNCKAHLSSSSGSNFLNVKAAPLPVARFHALSGFYAVYNMLNLSARANMTNIWEKGQQLCSRSWADLSRISGNQNFIGQYCFRVPYLASLIEDALCLGDAEIYFGPGDVSWTLGAALVEGKYLGPSTTEAQTSISTLKLREVVSSPIFLFVLLVCLVFIVYHSQIKLPMPGKKGAAAGAPLPSYIYPKRCPN